jgi:hypothetical protein
MLDPQNLVNVSGGLVADPELVADGRILKLRLAIDYAGSEKDSDNKSGYFDVIYYIKDNNGFTSKNASFVASQISDGKMKKGSSLSLIGRLLQERWKQDEKNQSKTVIVAEHLTYGQRSSNGASKGSDSAPAKEATTVASASSIPQSF